MRLLAGFWLICLRFCPAAYGVREHQGLGVALRNVQYARRFDDGPDVIDDCSAGVRSVYTKGQGLLDGHKRRS